MARPKLPRVLGDLSDAKLLELGAEPDTQASLSPLERELLVRLGAAVDYAEWLEAELSLRVRVRQG